MTEIELVPWNQEKSRTFLDFQKIRRGWSRHGAPRRSRLTTRNRDSRGVDKVGARHKGGSDASKGMRESASNHEFNAFYHGSPSFFRAEIIFPQSPSRIVGAWNRRYSAHSSSPSLSFSLSVQCRQPANDRITRRDFARDTETASHGSVNNASSTTIGGFGADWWSS